MIYSRQITFNMTVEQRGMDHWVSLEILFNGTSPRTIMYEQMNNEHIDGPLVCAARMVTDKFQSIFGYNDDC